MEEPHSIERKSKENKEKQISIKKNINVTNIFLKLIIKRNNFKKNIILNNNIRFIVSVYLAINLIISNLSIKNYLSSFIYKNSYISLKIKGTGNLYIFGNNKNGITCSYDMPPLPDEIYINEIKQENINNNYYFNESENTVKLIWENNINKTTCMFLTCPNITEVDLSNFDSSQVTNIHAMFFGCSSLISVNLPNFYVLNDKLNRYLSKTRFKLLSNK